MKSTQFCRLHDLLGCVSECVEVNQDVGGRASEVLSLWLAWLASRSVLAVIGFLFLVFSCLA